VFDRGAGAVARAPKEVPMTADEPDLDVRETDPPTSPEAGDHHEPVDLVATDPSTGSTPPDPRVDEVGPPPAGADPMAGEAPSG
jgi:hypothetical protein